MSILAIQLKRITPFVYVLILLLLFNLFFNINFQWAGISLIVRVYIFVFSFYLIFNYASIETEKISDIYKKKYGGKSELLLFMETRAMPFLLIYLITIIFTMIDYLRLPNWPWDPIISLLNGRYSNILIYSLFLFLILKIKKGPGIQILIFSGTFVIYYFLDKLLYFLSPGVSTTFIVKILKFFIVFFLLFNNFFVNKSKIKLMLISAITSAILVIIIISSNIAIYKRSDNLTYQKRESGLILLKYGFSFPMDGLKRIIVQKSDLALFNESMLYIRHNKYELDISPEEWKKMLFSGSVKMADAVAQHIIKKNINISYNQIVNYAEKKSLDTAERIESANNLILLAAKHISGNEKDFQKRLIKSNNSFKLWGIAVLGEQKKIESIPFLIDFLTDIDVNLISASYDSLKKITGLDPEEKLNVKKNNPDVLIMFKEYYLRSL